MTCVCSFYTGTFSICSFADFFTPGGFFLKKKRLLFAYFKFRQIRKLHLRFNELQTGVARSPQTADITVNKLARSLKILS